MHARSTRSHATFTLTGVLACAMCPHAVLAQPGEASYEEAEDVTLDLDTSERGAAGEHGVSGWYLRGGPVAHRFDDTDFSIFGVDFESGGGVLVAGGYDFGPVTGNPPRDFNIGLRAEAEFSALHSDVDSVAGTSVNGDIGAASLYVNGYVDFDFPGPVTLFAGLGIGNNAVAVDIDGFVDDEDTALGAQFMLGLEVDIRSGWGAYVNVRHRRYDDMEFDGLEVDDLENSAISAGVRYSF
ncbi:MAG: outer membrane protein [Phycisphaerales bacterium JB040]